MAFIESWLANHNLYRPSSDIQVEPFSGLEWPMKRSVNE